MKNDIAFQMNGGNIKGSVKTNFEKSSLGFDYSLGGSKILVSNLKSDSGSFSSRVTTNEGKATKGFTIAMSVAL